VESSAKYLGSLITSDGKDTADVEARIRQANGASGSLLKCVFKRKDVTKEAKVAVYNSLILSVLLYGCESWSLTQRLRDKLRSFHRRCVRSMCRISMWHVQHYHITAQDLEHRLGVRSFETYLVRRRLRWLGHVRRMPWDRLPRKLLTAWVAEPRVPGGQEMTYGRSILEDLRLAEEAGMVFPEAEVVLEEEVTAENDGLEELTIAELRDKCRVLSVVPAGTDREKRRPEPWVIALRVARAAVWPAAAAAVAAAAAARAAAERARATVEAVHEAVCARPRVRTLNTANHDGWQRGERLDGRDAVLVAVQQRVTGADSADEADDDDGAFEPGTTAEADGEDSDGYWWWQSTEARAEKWVVPQWEVLAAGRVGWDGGLKKVRVNESGGSSGGQE